jgi:GntR family transcriptional regulator/MocR family aminotransferase
VTPRPRIQIDLNSTTPVNRQIVDQLRTQFVEGTVAQGAVMPSVRRLAIDLGVHFNTVADAYRTLADEGWLEVAQGRSVRVLERVAPRESPEARALFRQRLRQLLADARAQGLPSATLARELSAMLERIKS